MPARRQLAEQHLGARVGPLDRRPRGAHEAAVEVRRGGGADAPRHARLLRLEPARDVRLVPDQVAVDAVAVARRHRAGELRRTAPGSACSAGCACAALRLVHSGPGPVTLSITRIPAARVRSTARSSVVPVVAARAVVRRVEARLAAASRCAAGETSIQRAWMRTMSTPAAAIPAIAVSALHGLGQQQPLVLHPDLEVRGRRRRRDGGGQHEQARAGEDRARPPAAHRGATRASREVSPPALQAPHAGALRHAREELALARAHGQRGDRREGPAAGRPVLDLDHLRRRVGGRADLAVDPQPRAAPADPDRQPVGLVGGLGAAVEEAQAGLEARQRRLVDQLVLGHRAHAAVPVGHPVGLVDVAGLERHAHAEDAVGRVGLEAELGVEDRQAARDPRRARRLVEHAAQPRGRGDRDLAGGLGRLGGRPRAAALVRVVGEALDREALELAAAVRAALGAAQAPPARVEAEQLAQELDGRDRAPRERPARAADRGGLAQQHLVAAVAARPQPLDPRRRQRPVDDRRGRDEAALLALVLRRQPARLVGLVQHRPAAHAREHPAALVLVG